MINKTNKTMETEFNQIATKAAFLTMDKMRTEIDQNLRFAERMEESADSKDNTEQGNSARDQELVFAASARMEAELLTRNIEKLQQQVETQIFDF